MKRTLMCALSVVIILVTASCKKNIEQDNSAIYGKWKCAFVNTTSTSSSDTLSLFRLVGSDLIFNEDGSLITQGGPADMGMNNVHGSYFVKNNILYMTGEGRAAYMTIKTLEDRDLVTEMKRNGEKLTFEFKRQ